MASSLESKNSRYIFGGKTEATPLRLEWWERKTFRRDLTDMSYIIEQIYEGRPDKLAYVTYGDSSLWWILLQYNNILDLTEEFIAGREILVPTRERVLSEFLSGATGSIPSTRHK